MVTDDFLGSASTPRRISMLRTGYLTMIVAMVAGAFDASAQVPYDQPPIRYRDATPDNVVSRLQAALQQGECQLAHDSQTGYLRALLERLEIPISSQVLVFSKTSFQQRKISPSSPRALYFNDDVYVGWVIGGDVIELSAADPLLGATFYTLSQASEEPPDVERQVDDCLACHGGSMSQGVPGHIVRSVFPDVEGRPLLSAGSFLVDQTTPLRDRWGGWYVTGTHGVQQHMGNQWFENANMALRADRSTRGNVTSLSRFCDLHNYLSPHSDLLALMVLEHQTKLHNLLTDAAFQTRYALRNQRVINEMLGRPAEYLSESTEQRIERSAQRIVRYMLFCDEAPIRDGLSGTSQFAEQFIARGPRDRQGRSLREFDGRNRLFKYPCSYLVYSDVFRLLPKDLQKRVYRQLWQVVSGQNSGRHFGHLSPATRRAIMEILLDTHPDLPDDWREEVSGT